jgi:FkbM family methyltransferase
MSSPCVGQEGRVWAIEPDPIAFSVLEHSIRLSEINNISCINMAASDQAGSVALFRSVDGLMNSLYDSAACSDQVEVASVTLDNVFGNLRVDGLKIDVEGAEPRVLRGAVKMIERNPDLWIVTEIRPKFLRQVVALEPSEYLQMLWNLDFSTFYIDEEGRRLIQIFLGDCPSLQWGNLLCVRADSLRTIALLSKFQKKQTIHPVNLPAMTPEVDLRDREDASRECNLSPG